MPSLIKTRENAIIEVTYYRIPVTQQRGVIKRLESRFPTLFAYNFLMNERLLGEYP